MVDLWSDFWMRETGTGQRVAQLHERYIIIIIIIITYLHGLIAPSGPGSPQYRGPTITDTPKSVGLLWTSDQPVAEASTWQHTTLTIDKHPYARRDSNPQYQQASGRRCMPLSARPLGQARCNCVLLCSEHFEFMTKKLERKGSKMDKNNNKNNCTQTALISLCFFVLMFHCL